MYGGTVYLVLSRKALTRLLRLYRGGLSLTRGLACTVAAKASRRITTRHCAHVKNGTVFMSTFWSAFVRAMLSRAHKK